MQLVEERRLKAILERLINYAPINMADHQGLLLMVSFLILLEKSLDTEHSARFRV